MVRGQSPVFSFLAFQRLVLVLRREFLILCLVAGGVFLTVATACFWIGYSLQVHAADIVRDTIPGLVDTGSAMAMTQENWFRLYEFLQTQSPAERDALASPIRANSNARPWQDYAYSINDKEVRSG
jgi:hypothetical protein